MFVFLAKAVYHSVRQVTNFRESMGSGVSAPEAAQCTCFMEPSASRSSRPSGRSPQYYLPQVKTCCSLHLDHFLQHNQIRSETTPRSSSSSTADSDDDLDDARDSMHRGRSYHHDGIEQAEDGPGLLNKTQTSFQQSHTLKRSSSRKSVMADPTLVRHLTMRCIFQTL